MSYWLYLITPVQLATRGMKMMCVLFVSLQKPSEMPLLNTRYGLILEDPISLLEFFTDHRQLAQQRVIHDQNSRLIVSYHLFYLREC